MAKNTSPRSNNSLNQSVSQLSILREEFVNENYLIQIYSIDGRLIIQKDLNSVYSNEINSVDGIYVYRIIDGKNLIQAGKLLYVNGK